jgi:hypothetical protein
VFWSSVLDKGEFVFALLALPPGIPFFIYLHQLPFCGSFPPLGLPDPFLRPVKPRLT